jgi:hypothetical protein
MPGRVAALWMWIGVSACTSLTTAADCADGTCPEGQTCDSPTRLCVLDLAPQIAVLAPRADAGVRESILEVRGTVATRTDSTLVDMSFQLVDAGIAGPVSLDGGVFAADIPLPPIDGQALGLVLIARDNLGREGRRSVPLFVDGVAPRPRFNPPDGARGTDTELEVDFGELVAGALMPVASTPPIAGGAFDAESRRFRVSGLEHDTGYRMTVDPGVVTDRLGNPNLGATVRFWTAARPARSGVIDGLGSVRGFAVHSDDDGVVTLAIETADQVVWGGYRPGDGEFELISLLDIVAGPLTSLRVLSASQVDAGLDPIRVSTVVMQDTGFRSFVRVGASFGTPSATAVIPTAPSCAEPAAALGGLGLVDASGSYARPAGASLALGFVPEAVAVRSPEAWEAVASDQHRLRRAFFRARCAPPTLEVVREPPSRTDVADVPHLSVALARADRSLLVLETVNGTRVEICQSCQETPDAGSCPTTVERNATGGLTVASRHDGARVIGARRNGAGLLDLLERDLSSDCGSAWVVLGTAPDSAAAVQWEPAMFGRKPGLVFSTATDVRLYVP